MELNEQSELTSKKEKGLRDMDSNVIAGGGEGGIKGLKGNGKKIQLKKKETSNTGIPQRDHGFNSRLLQYNEL